MTKTLMHSIIVTGICLTLMAAAASAQAPPAAAPPTPPTPPFPLATPSFDVPTRSAQIEVQLVVSRWQGDKKVSSLPYTLAVNAGNQPEGHRDLARLRMGASVPVFDAAGRGDSAQSSQGARAYRDIGTNIDCTAFLTDDGRYRLQLTVEDSSVYADDRTAASGGATAPTFRQFRLSNVATLRDGQTTQFVSAADKITGELLKIDVSVKVIK